MTKAVEKLAEDVKALQKQELDEFLDWLANYELQQSDEWDEEISRDLEPGGRLAPLLARARADIAAGRTKPLDEVIDNF